MSNAMHVIRNAFVVVVSVAWLWITFGLPKLRAARKAANTPEHKGPPRRMPKRPPRASNDEPRLNHQTKAATSLRESAEEALVLLTMLDPQHGVTAQLRAALLCPENEPPGDSETLTRLIAMFRERERCGRGKYGTTVDRDDLRTPDWRQHLREELMDALLYSLAESRCHARESR